MEKLIYKVKKMRPLLIICLFASVLYSFKINSNSNRFKFMIRYTENNVKLTSKKGFSWIELNLNFNNKQNIYITEEGELSELKNSKSVIIELSKKDNEILIKGIKGTKWKELSFSCNHENCIGIINENGIKVKG